jgi:hypothetical protein
MYKLSNLQSKVQLFNRKSKFLRIYFCLSFSLLLFSIFALDNKTSKGYEK